MDKVNRLLIDGDILRYEIGFAGQPKDKETGETSILPFETVNEILEGRIKTIRQDTNPEASVEIYLTIDKKLAKKLGIEYKPNFRDSIAITKPYKGTRKNDKPYHFDNLTTILLHTYNCILACGIEADDLIGREQHEAEPETTIICSRDKDLRQVPGWHYSWECGKQPSHGPFLATELGCLFYTDDKKPKLMGYGGLFYYYQLLAGDVVDNIPGLPGIGEVKAYKLLKDCKTLEEADKIIHEKYKEVLGDEYTTYLREQSTLLRIDYDQTLRIDGCGV